MAAGAEAAAVDMACAAKGVPAANKAANTPNHATAAFRMATGSTNFALPRQSRDKVRTSDINFLRRIPLSRTAHGSAENGSEAVSDYCFCKLYEQPPGGHRHVNHSAGEP
jgi:hypothetical protein